jgi:hypothetical protein
MKQVFYTSCTKGSGLEDISGQQIRAASAGMSLGRLNALKETMGYALPSGVSPQVAPEEAPDRLAFMNSEPDGGERVLVHVTYVQHDPASGRLGNSFVHLLTDLPPDFTVQQAIQTWDSSRWVRSDQGGGTALDDLAEFQPGPLNDQHLIDYARTPAGAQYLEFLATAVLCREPDQKVFLVSEPRDAALCIYGLTRLVPAGLLKNFSFSTYERYPELANIHLIATCWPDLASQDLPRRCYEGIGMGLHTATGHQSALKQRYAFITAGIAALQRGDIPWLTHFHEVCAEQHAESLSVVETIFDLFFTRPKQVFTRDDITALTQTPRLLAKMCPEPGFLEHALMLAERDTDFLSSTFPLVVASCQQNALVLSKLVTLTREQGYLAFQENAVERAQRLFTQILPTISPMEAVQAHQRLVTDISRHCSPQTPTDALSLDTRLAVAHLVTAQHVEWTKADLVELTARWIRFTPEECARWLQSDLAQPIRRYVAIVALARKALPDAEIAEALADDKSLGRTVYLDLAQERSREVAERWFNALASTPKHLLELLRWLAEEEQTQKTLPIIQPTLQAALAALDEQMIQLEDWQAIIEWLASHGELLAKDVRELATAWNSLARFLNDPQLSEWTVKNLRWAMQILRAHRGTVPGKTLISRTLGASIEGLDETEVVLLQWGPVLAEDILAWYKELLEDITHWHDDWATTFFPLFVVYLGLGGAEDPDLARQLPTEQLIPAIGQALLQMDHRMYKMIAHSAKGWDNPMRKHWTSLQIDRRGTWQRIAGIPKTLLHRLRRRPRSGKPLAAPRE